MATLTGLILVTVGTFEAYQGGGWGGIPLGEGGGAGNAERRTIYMYIYIYGICFLDPAKGPASHPANLI